MARTFGATLWDCSANAARRRIRVLYGLFFAAQLAIVATVFRRPDETFAFRMFSEASTVEPQLFRIYVADDGSEHTEELTGNRLAALIGRREFDRLGLRRVAGYGAEVQRFRWRGAVAYAAQTWPPSRRGDFAREAETARDFDRALVLRLRTTRNGHPPVVTEDRFPIAETAPR